MKKFIAILLSLGLGVGLAVSQLADYPNPPKPNDSVQILTYKTALSTNGGMPIPAHDAEVYQYNGSNITAILYKVGGVNGRTVGMVVLTYSGSNVISRALTIQ